MDHKCLFTYFCFWDGYDDRQKPMGKLPWDFFVITESQELGLKSHPKDIAYYSIVSSSLYWAVISPVVHSGHHFCGPLKKEWHSTLVQHQG